MKDNYQVVMRKQPAIFQTIGDGALTGWSALDDHTSRLCDRSRVRQPLTREEVYLVLRQAAADGIAVIFQAP